MNEIKCQRIDYKKLAPRIIIDFLVIFILLYFIAFIENIVNDFSSSFSYIFKEKRIMFFLMLAISFALSAVLAFIDVGSRCSLVKYDEDKLIFVRSNKEITMKIAYGLLVRSDIKENNVIIGFRQDKKAVNAYLNKTDGLFLINHIRAKGIAVGSQTGKRKVSNNSNGKQAEKTDIEETAELSQTQQKDE